MDLDTFSSRQRLSIPKRVFFSFHDQDVADFWAYVVCNLCQTKPDRESAGDFAVSVWEKAKKEGSIAIKRLINNTTQHTSNTCVLIGSAMFSRLWVRCKAFKSFVCRNYIFGVHVNGLPDEYCKSKAHGPNLFDCHGITISGDGDMATLRQTSGGGWFEFKSIDGSTQVSVSLGKPFRGKTYLFFQAYTSFDWIRDNGCANISGRVK